jgi:hypothetical protein
LSLSPDFDAVPFQNPSGVNAPVQAQNSLGSPCFRQARWRDLDLPPPSTIPVVKEAADDEVADSRIAQETSSEDEGYEHIDRDDDGDDQTLQQGEDEGNVYATPERVNNIEEPTPIEIKSALRALDHSRISPPIWSVKSANGVNCVENCQMV